MMTEAKKKNAPKEAVKAEIKSTLMNSGYKWKFADAEKPENVEFVANDVIKHSETLSFSSKDAQFRWVLRPGHARPVWPCERQSRV